MRAASLNYRDLIVVGEPPRPGLVPLSDGAGEVVEVAPDVRPAAQARWSRASNPAPGAAA